MLVHMEALLIYGCLKYICMLVDLATMGCNLKNGDCAIGHLTVILIYTVGCVAVSPQPVGEVADMLDRAQFTQDYSGHPCGTTRGKSRRDLQSRAKSRVGTRTTQRVMLMRTHRGSSSSRRPLITSCPVYMPVTVLLRPAQLHSPSSS